MTTSEERPSRRFNDKWQDQALVLDKWFTAQAASPLPDTLDQVKALTGHPDFSMSNPNKVRALIFAFAVQNPTLFHRADGAGYRFVMDRIIALDKLNHNVAARLAGCFNLWKRYDEARRGHMNTALETIAGTKGLSKNVYEIVSRALA